MTKPPALSDLVGTEWVLADFGGIGVSEGAEATLAFPQSGRVTGKAFCNRFTGSTQIMAEKISFGQNGQHQDSLPACADGYSKGTEKPLRFTRKPP